MALEKDLKIKTGIVTRLYKEYYAYLKEEETQKKRIERIKSEGADEHDIRKQYEVLQETEVMIPDCKKRLQKAKFELEKLLNANETFLNGKEELQEAKDALQKAEEIQ
ncbi:hypothetical protein MP638_005183 [Amoeboaphelidium occidentale]|nr:hypothetical protein MP638_005183 [Amoeboaphelidium occidentale]